MSTTATRQTSQLQRADPHPPSTQVPGRPSRGPDPRGAAAGLPHATPDPAIFGAGLGNRRPHI
ncbi:hypothetical protein IMZ48_27630 [Candidatus Bathyarchaeota archaeon]|nr:hypothetical protein [Candidatus Bathyarchaeota archaeon]